MNYILDDEDDCQKILFELRWPSGRPRCPLCESTVLAQVEAFKWRCRGSAKGCKDYKFSVTAGTPFAKIQGLKKWFYIGYNLIAAPNTISKRRVSANLKISEAQSLRIIQVWKHLLIETNLISSNAVSNSEEVFKKLLCYVLENDFRKKTLLKPTKLKDFKLAPKPIVEYATKDRKGRGVITESTPRQLCYAPTPEHLLSMTSEESEFYANNPSSNAE